MNEIVKISIENVAKSFVNKDGSRLDVLKDVSFKAYKGEFVCILGPSGCGKSTILNLIAGFEKPSNGQVLLDGGEILKPGPNRGMVFQQPTLMPWLNVLQNITFGPRLAHAKKDAYIKTAKHFIDLVGLREFSNHMPWQLSGGTGTMILIGLDGQLLSAQTVAVKDAQERVNSMAKAKARYL